MPNKSHAKRLTKPNKQDVISRQAFLDKISDVLFTSFEDDHTIKKIAQLIISNIADYCRILTLDEKNNIRDISVNHADPSKIQQVTDLYDAYTDNFDATQGVHKILKTGKAELLPVLDQKILDSIKDNPRLLKIVQDIGLKSYMGIPLMVHGKTIGAITFSSVKPGRHYSKEDLVFVSEVGRRIALALDNARLYREAEKARLDAERERKRLHDLFMEAPAMISVTQGPKHVYEFANPLYLKVVGKTNDIIGQSVAQVFPELKGQGILEILDKVYKTGKPFIGKEALIKLDIHNRGIAEDVYFDFVYQASRNADGTIDGILTHAVDVSDKVQARKKVERSEERFRALTEKSADAVALTDASGIVIYASTSVKKLLGYSAKEMVGMSGAVFVHPDDLEMTRIKLGGVTKAPGKSLSVEHRVIHKDGSIRWMETTATNLFNEPSVGALVTNFKDITERRRAEDVLEDTRNQLESALAAGTIAAWIWDIPSNRITGDKNMAHFFGMEPSKVKAGVPPSAFINVVHKSDRPGIQDHVERVLRSGEDFEAEYRLVTRLGAIRWVIARGKLEYNAEGKAVRFPGVLMDITERKEAEQRLRDSEERARAVFDQAAAAMSLTTLDGKWIDFNRMYPKMFGYSRAQLKKMTFTDLTHPDDRAADKVNISLLLRGEIKEYTREKRYIHKNGSIVFAVIHVTAVRNAAGQPQYIIAVLQDITKRKQMEESIQNSEIRHRTMVEQSPLSTQIMSPDGKTLQVNKAWEDLWGLKFDQLSGYNMLQDQQLIELGIMPYIKRGFAGKSTFIPAIKYEPNKTIPGANEVPYRWVQAFIYPVKNKKSAVREVVLIHEDITKQKRAEDRLRESEQRLRFMSESLPQKVFTADPTGSIDYFNPQWMQYTGLSFEQIRDWGWVQFVHPDDVDENVRRWRHSVDTGEPFEMEHRFRRYDGTYRWHISRAQAMHDENGKIIRWFGSNTDIDDMRRTTKRKNELESITASLTAQRAELVALNKAKDEFISLASHQLRTPATGVKQYLGMTLEGYAGELNDQQTVFLTQAYESNERQINIVNDLLQVAKIDAGKVTLEKENIDLVALVNDIISEQKATFKNKNQKVVFAPSSTTFNAVADRNRMRMVLENIIDNASKYTPQNKRIDIILSTDDKTIKIAVKDHGVGVKKSDIERMFDKFSRIDNPLSVVVGGSGLGLYWAKKIIDLHGGTIEVKSQLEKGSTFTIQIPLAQESKL